MISPELFHALDKSYTKMQRAGHHTHVQPPPLDMVTELAGMMVQKQHSMSPTNKQLSKKAKESVQWVVPRHIRQALQAHAMVDKDRTSSALSLDFSNNVTHLWSNRQRDTLFGLQFNPLATKFTGFSICHPMYDDEVMLKWAKHALKSAITTTKPTTTFMLLPNWKGMGTSAYTKLVRENPGFCATLAIIPKSSVTYDHQSVWIGAPTLPSPPQWD